jgi:hypothetical protein
MLRSEVSFRWKPLVERSWRLMDLFPHPISGALDRLPDFTCCPNDPSARPGPQHRGGFKPMTVAAGV